MDLKQFEDLKKIYDNITKASLYDMQNSNLSGVNDELIEKLESDYIKINKMNSLLQSIVSASFDYEDILKKNYEELSEINKINKRKITDNKGNPNIMTMHLQILPVGKSWGDIMEDSDKQTEIREQIDQNLALDITEAINSENTILDSDDSDDSDNSDDSLDSQKRHNNIKIINSINNVAINNDLELPIVDKLTNIPQSFYWYCGDDINPEGIYTCLVSGFIVQVPFPDVIDSSNNVDKSKTIRCKNTNIRDCIRSRQELADRYKSNIRNCNYAHTGDKLNKLGTMFRCSTNIGLGHHASFIKDIEKADKLDISNILIYALSDALISSVWYEYHHGKNNIPLTLINIDEC